MGGGGDGSGGAGPPPSGGGWRWEKPPSAGRGGSRAPQPKSTQPSPFPRLRAPTGAPLPEACASGVLPTNHPPPPAPILLFLTRVLLHRFFSSWIVLGAARRLQHPFPQGHGVAAGPRLGLAPFGVLSRHPKLGDVGMLGGPVHPTAGAGAPTSLVEGEMRVLSSSGSCGKGGVVEPHTGALRVLQNPWCAPPSQRPVLHHLLPMPHPPTSAITCPPCCPHWGTRWPGCRLGRSHPPWGHPVR